MLCSSTKTETEIAIKDIKQMLTRSLLALRLRYHRKL